MLAGGIDSVIGTNFADYLQADKDAFNAMYKEAVQSDEGLFGLKRTLGLTTDATKKTADEADGFVEVLGAVGVTAETTEQQMSDLKSSVDWLLDGFRWFGEEVGWIITSLFSPFAELCAWIDSAIQGMSIFNGLRKFSNPNYDVYNDSSMWTSNFATGGFPDEGQLFVAREAGPEMVGTIGGRTAVGSNDQIVEGIRQGVYDAVMAANGNGNNDVSVRVFLDSREIKAGQQRLNRAWGV